ncbi:unnamed protein product [Choristocarpus tenellus]
MAGPTTVPTPYEQHCEYEAGENASDQGSSLPVESSDQMVGGHLRQERTSGLKMEPDGPAGESGYPVITVARHGRTAAFKPGRLTVVLDMDECLLHSKFHGPGAASEAYRQLEDRPDDVNDVNSFWVALDDGDTAQVNKRPGLDGFLAALARDYNTIVFTAAMPDYAGPVLDYIDPKGELFHQRLYRNSCRQVKGAFLKDLTVVGAECGDLSRIVLVDNNPLSFICQPTNGILVASFYDDPNDSALASVLQLIRHLDQAKDVRPFLKGMFRLDTLLCEYRTALFDDGESLSLGDEDQPEDTTEELLGSMTNDETSDANNDVDLVYGEEEHEAGTGEGEVQVGETIPKIDLHGGDGAQMCLFQDEAFECGGKRDDDDESVETEVCSVESSVDSLPSGEMDVEF